MPFLYVQLARWGGAQYTQYVRQAQLDTLTDPNLKNTANLGMTVTIDTDQGTSSVIHPLGKDIIAARMASQWRAIRAHKSIPSGPRAAAARRTGDGTVQLTFQSGTAQGCAPHRRRHGATHVPERHRAGIARDETGLFALGERRRGGDCHVATGRRVRSGRFQWRGPQGHGLNQWRHRHIALSAGARNQPSAVPVGRRARSSLRFRGEWAGGVRSRRGNARACTSLRHCVWFTMEP